MAKLNGENAPFTHALVPGAGVHLHAVSTGAGKTVLFLHGFPEFWYAWKKQLDWFRPQYQAVAVDMRGYNRSDRPAAIDAYTLPRLVADVVAVLDHFSPDQPAILIGHDWGGVVAWHMAAAHPERLEKLVIINAPHPAVFTRELINNPAQRRASSYIGIFRSRAAETLLRAGHFALLNQIVFGLAAPGAFSPQDRRAYHKAWSQTGALTGGLNYYRAVGFDTAATIPPIPTPTLVIWGEKDTALLAGSLVGLDQYVPNLTVARIPSGTHWVTHEHPEMINQLIQEFITVSEK